MNAHIFSYGVNENIVIKVSNRTVFEAPDGMKTEIVVQSAVQLEKKNLWEILDTPTADLPLPTRALNALIKRQEFLEKMGSIERARYWFYRHDNKWVGNLLMMKAPEFLLIKNFGPVALKNLAEILVTMGVPLGTPIGDWIPPDQRQW